MTQLYALITSGTVTNVILGLPSPTWTPPTGETVVAIPDGTTAAIGYTYANGTFTAPVVTPPALTLAQQAAAALSDGLAITSTSTPALSATYPVDATTQAQIQAEMIAILANGVFASGTDTLEWQDMSGALHTFTIAQFRTLATAIAAYVAALLSIIKTGAGTLPAATATIA